MKSALLFAALFATATVSQALTLKGSTELTEWNTSQAGQALLKQDAVHAKADIALTGELKLNYKGYAKGEACDEYGDSPNGEPEFAPCLKSHATWAPKFEVSVPATVTASVEDLQSVAKMTLSADLTSCIENYESLILTKAPMSAPARVTLKSSCDIYVMTPEIKVAGKSSALANSSVETSGQVMLEGKIKSARTMTIDDGKVSADTAKEIAEAAKTLKGGDFFSKLSVTATVKSRSGKALGLFNHSLDIELK